VTQYYVENTTKGTNSGWITSTYWDSCGLECGKFYDFRVKARNGDGVETGWTNLPNAQTAACENPQTEEFTFTGMVARRSEVRHPVNVKPGALSMYAKLTWGVVDDLRLRIYDPNGAMVAEVDKSTYGNNVEEITRTNPMAGEWKVAVYSESYWRSVSYSIQVVVSY
jgi:hypothetical protein